VKANMVMNSAPKSKKKKNGKHQLKDSVRAS